MLTCKALIDYLSRFPADEGVAAIIVDLEKRLHHMIGASTDIVPERILLAAHPLVDDPDAALAEMEEQRKRRAKEAQAAFGAYGQPPADGDE